MNDAPERIWVGTYDDCSSDNEDEWALNVPYWRDDAIDPHFATPYILDTPEALAKSDTVRALVKAAVEAERERCAENIAAIERLAISASIASCTCDVKTPDITFHTADCRYVKLQYITAQCEDFRDAAIREVTP